MRRARGLVLTSVFVLVASAAPAADAPKGLPAIHADIMPTVTREYAGGGRKHTEYEVECLKEWGYPEGSGKSPFVVSSPEKGPEHPPLLVYLHAAGGKADGNIRNAGPEFVVLMPDCHGPMGPDGWWGWFWAKKDPATFAHKYSPPEERVLATIEWTIRKYNVDRNRVYMWGHSMGGSGTLGLGMARGDIFAAIWVGVPANVDHLWSRMGLPDMKKPDAADYRSRVSAVGLPDPPPVVNFSSPVDGWALAQEDFLKVAQDGRLPLIFCWAPFGHTQDYSTANPAVLEFPWKELRRNEAYPVFTHASTDAHYPGYMVKNKPDQAGQINGYFRWKALADTPAKLQMELRLVDPKELKKPVEAPETSTVDVTPRRLQQFKPVVGKPCAWTLAEGGKTVASGKAAPDEIGLLTVPQLALTKSPRVLTIEAAK